MGIHTYNQSFFFSRNAPALSSGTSFYNKMLNWKFYKFISRCRIFKNTRIFGVLIFMVLLWMIKGEKWVMGGKELRHLFFSKKKKPCMQHKPCIHAHTHTYIHTCMHIHTHTRKPCTYTDDYCTKINSGVFFSFCHWNKREDSMWVYAMWNFTTLTQANWVAYRLLNKKEPKGRTDGVRVAKTDEDQARARLSISRCLR
jgi:hypothetical protein